MSAAAGDRSHSRQARLRQLQRGTTVEAALAFYDTLDPAGVAEIIGSWRGEGLRTDNPFDGVLERFGWHGKRFDGPDDAHPLVFRAGAGRKVSINPALVPLAALARHPSLLRAPVVPVIFSAVRPLITTRKPRARLRLVEYRGAVTAAMSYDALPVDDAFRKVDGHTLVGATDLRGLEAPFMFVLRREPPAPPGPPQ